MPPLGPPAGGFTAQAFPPAEAGETMHNPMVPPGAILNTQNPMAPPEETPAEIRRRERILRKKIAREKLFAHWYAPRVLELVENHGAQPIVPTGYGTNYSLPTVEWCNMKGTFTPKELSVAKMCIATIDQAL
jgi:hypothetical protein